MEETDTVLQWQPLRGVLGPFPKATTGKDRLKKNSMLALETKLQTKSLNSSFFSFPSSSPHGTRSLLLRPSHVTSLS